MRSNYPPIQRAEIAVDAAPPIDFPTPDFCLKGATAAGMLQEINTGEVVKLKGFVTADATPVMDVRLQTDGLEQALTLRDWILAQYAAGKLKLAP